MSDDVGMPHNIFDALSAYLGGKRRLAPVIFSLLAQSLPPERWPHTKFLDPMCGGGAVALYAKAQGFDVVAGDASRIGEVAARALIANSETRLEGHHLLSLLRGEPLIEGPASDFVPRVFTAFQAVWLNTALAAAGRHDDPARSLLELVTVRTALRLQPMSMLDGSDAHRITSGEFDDISSPRLRHYLRADRALRLSALEALAASINAGVFGGRGMATRGDARQAIADSDAAVVYLDPPYPKTTGYREPYAPLRVLLGDAMTDVVPTLDELLAAAAHIPIAVISYGGRGVTLDSFVQTVSSYRRVVRALAIPYPHLPSLARKEQSDANREFIIVATR